MPINDTYVAPEPVLTYLCQGERSFLGLRLIHGLLYVLDNAVRGDMKLVPARFHSVHGIRTSNIAAAVAPERAKDNRWIHAACAELVAQGVLRTAEIQGRAFRFQLGKEFVDAFARPSKAFAIMRTDEVRQCKTLHDLMFLSLARLHGGKDRPRFLLPRIHCHLEMPSSKRSVLPPKLPMQEPWRASWGKSSRSWVKAATRMSGILGHSYLIAPRQDMIDDFVSEVAVKVQTPKTIWERGKLYKFPPGTRGVVEIPAGGSKSVLSAKALQEKWHQTEIR